jgi:hypothetical protein
MASQRDIDRRNDARLLTPLLLMALVIAAGVSVLRADRPCLGGHLTDRSRATPFPICHKSLIETRFLGAGTTLFQGWPQSPV